MKRSMCLFKFERLGSRLVAHIPVRCVSQSPVHSSPRATMFPGITLSINRFLVDLELARKTVFLGLLEPGSDLH
ncbi:hypothetical protein AHF37_03841 [Paragonimus kellicotti]|nr:hypothetical protein AHF37_03841 [Paragonimus kellicotti]